MTQSGSTVLRLIAWLSLGIAFACAIAIAYDIFVRGFRQRMGIMDAVYPITALYLGPLALQAYERRGRRESPQWARRCGADPEKTHAEDSGWWPIAKAVSHCGAGCTLGDIVGDWIVFATAFSIPSFATEDANALMAMFAVDVTLAWTFGIVFQYFSIVPMRKGVGRLEGIWLAVKADTLSIAAFQVGLFGFMALYHLVLFQPPLTVASAGYWMMMQIGMVAGFLTAWPVNAWLIKRGWKERM